MTTRNPIDQRHANPQGIHCPVFWRRFGSRFSLFLAVYPWVVTTAMYAEDAVRMYYYSWRNLTLPGATLPTALENFLLSNEAWIRGVMEVAMMTLVITGFLFLVPVGLMWWGLTLLAWWRGFVGGWLCLVSTVFGFGGILVFLVAFSVFHGSLKS